MADEEQFQTDPSEGGILSLILNDASGNELLTLTTQITPSDFLDSRNRIIYQTMLDLGKKNSAVTIETVLSALEDNKELEDAGGKEYLQFLKDDCYSPLGSKGFVSTLLDHSLLNQLINKMQQIIDDVKTKPIPDISEFIGKAESSITKITQKRRVAEIKALGEVDKDLIGQLVSQTEDFRRNGRKPNGVTGIETGYDQLDYLTKGWHKGDMIILGARPSVGKTAFALNLLYNVAKRGVPVIFFSLEMTSTSIAMRLLSLTSGLSSEEINSLEFEDGSTSEQVIINDHGDPKKVQQASQLRQGLSELNALPFYIDDNPGSKMMDIAAKARKLRNLIPDVGLIAIDYLGLITSPSKSNSDSRQNEVSDISRQIKQLARDLQVPILALSQLSRETEKRTDHKPQMSDIRDSGAIEQDADMILFLYREDYYKGQDGKENAPAVDDSNPISIVDLSLKKNRNGRVGDLKFSFDREHCSFNLMADPNQVGSNEPF